MYSNLVRRFPRGANTQAATRASASGAARMMQTRIPDAHPANAAEKVYKFGPVTLTWSPADNGEPYQGPHPPSKWEDVIPTDEHGNMKKLSLSEIQDAILQNYHFFHEKAPKKESSGGKIWWFLALLVGLYAFSGSTASAEEYDELAKCMPSAPVRKNFDPNERCVKNFSDNQLSGDLLENYGDNDVAIWVLSSDPKTSLKVRGPTHVHQVDPNDPLAILSTLNQLSQESSLEYVTRIIVLPEEPSGCSELVRRAYQEAVDRLVKESGFVVLAPKSSSEGGAYSGIDSLLTVDCCSPVSSQADILVEADNPVQATVLAAGQISRLSRGLFDHGASFIRLSPADIRYMLKRLPKRRAPEGNPSIAATRE